MTKKPVRSTSTRRPRAAASTPAVPPATLPAPGDQAAAPAPVATPARRRPAKASAAAPAQATGVKKPATPRVPKRQAPKAAAPAAVAPTPGRRRAAAAVAATPSPNGQVASVAPSVTEVAEQPLRVLVVASECSPHVSSGDLGDAVAALVDGLIASGHDVTCVVPRFPGVLPGASGGELRTIAMGDRSETVTLFRAEPAARLHLVAVDHAGFFARGHLYGADGVDYPDNPRRFAVLAMAACAIAGEAAVGFDVIHAFDWQAGLVPVLLRAGRRAPGAAVVFTVNAPVFQGRCGREWLPAFGLDERYASVDALEYWGGLSLLKGGINFADLVTVRDADRVVTPPGGWGFEGIFTARLDALASLALAGDPLSVGAHATGLYRRARGVASARAAE